jgi:hypothetical protein
MGSVLAAVRFVWRLQFEDHVLRPRAVPITEAAMAQYESRNGLVDA